MRRSRGATGALFALLAGAAAAAPAPKAPAATTAAPAPTAAAPAPTAPAPAKPGAPTAPPPAASAARPGAPSAPAAPGAVKPPPPPAAPGEYTLSLSQDEWRVRATLHPGEPQPGRLVELLFDVGRHKDATDPGGGDTTPFEGGKLALTITGPGTRSRYLVRALGDSGLYGVHWTPSAKGLWTLTLEPLAAPVAGLAGAAPTVTFQVGVGVPMPASAQGHAVQTSRVVVAAGRSVEEQTARSVKSLMAELGQRYLKLVDPAPGEESADARAELLAMSAITKGLTGRAPRLWAKESAEYDGLAQELTLALDRAGQLGDRKAQIAALPPLEQSSCLRCHLKFRDNVVTDLTAWPEVKR